jgi:hypothetical protein
MLLIARALGIGRPGESNPIRPGRDIRLFRSLHLNKWGSRFRFGVVLCWDGPYKHNAIGIKSSDWNGGNWPGGGSWRRQLGPLAMCRWGRRGNIGNDLRFERAMGCSCRHLTWLWVKGNGKVAHQPLCVLEEEND